MAFQFIEVSLFSQNLQLDEFVIQVFEFLETVVVLEQSLDCAVFVSE